MDYEAEVIQRFAAQLYAKSDKIVREYKIAMSLFFTSGGLFAGVMLAGVFPSAWTYLAAPLILGVVAGIYGARYGAQLGETKAFHYRLEAQTALCQMQIEKNTRPPADYMNG